MKNTLILLLLLFPILALAQYPATGNKMRLGWQTTGDGLVYRDAGAPSYTPNSRNNAYMYLDTVAQRLYRYTGGAWRDLSDEKYMHVQNSSVLAADVKDTLTIYDRLFVAMELTSAVGGNRGVQLPVTGLDSTYAGRVVRVSPLDSSATYNVFVSSSSPDGLLVDGVLQTSYDLESDETVEFQLYVFDTIYQWRLIHTSKTNDVVLPDSLIYGKGDPDWVAVFSPNDSTIKAGNIRDDGTDITYALPEVAYGIDDTSTPDAGTYGYNGATGRFAYYNAGWHNLISGNVTQNYLMRADANGNAVNAGIVDNGSTLAAQYSFLFKSYTTAGLPTPSLGMTVFNTNNNRLQFYNGTVWDDVFTPWQPVSTTKISYTGDEIEVLSTAGNRDIKLGANVDGLSGNGLAMERTANTYTNFIVTRGDDLYIESRDEISIESGSSVMMKLEEGTPNGEYDLPAFTGSENLVSSLSSSADIVIFEGTKMLRVDSIPSDRVAYDNGSSGIAATNVKDAIDEIATAGTYRNNDISVASGAGNYTEVFQYRVNAANNFTLHITKPGSIEQSGTYNFTQVYGQGNNNCYTLVPLQSTFRGSTQQFEVQVCVSGFTFIDIRIVNLTSNTLTGIDLLLIDNTDQASVTVKNAAGTGASTSLPVWINNKINQQYGKVSIGEHKGDVDAQLQVGGDFKVDSLDYESETLAGWTDDNVATKVTLGTGLNLTSGTLSATTTQDAFYLPDGTMIVGNDTIPIGIDTFQLTGTDLEISLNNDNQPLKTVALSVLQDGNGLFSIANDADTIPSNMDAVLSNSLYFNNLQKDATLRLIQSDTRVRLESYSDNNEIGAFYPTNATFTDIFDYIGTYALNSIDIESVSNDKQFYISVEDSLSINIQKSSTDIVLSYSEAADEIDLMENFKVDRNGRVEMTDYGTGSRLATQAEILAGYLAAVISGGEVKEVRKDSLIAAFNLQDKQQFVIEKTIFDADNPLPDSATSAAGVFNSGWWRVPESLDGATLTGVSFSIFNKGDLATTGAQYVLSVWYCDGDNANCSSTASVSFTPSSDRELELSGLSLTLDANDIFRISYTPPQLCVGGCGDENVNGLSVIYTIEK